MAETRVSELLWQRLCAMGLADRCGVGLRPLRAPRASRANGAWSWTAIDAEGIPLPLGSYSPMAQLLSAKRLVAILEHGDVTVDVYGDPPYPDHVRAGQWALVGLEQVLLEETS